MARGKHWLVFGRKNNQSPTLEGRERLLQNRVLLSNWLFFDDISARGDEIMESDYIKHVSNCQIDIDIVFIIKLFTSK